MHIRISKTMGGEGLGFEVDFEQSFERQKLSVVTCISTRLCSCPFYFYINSDQFLKLAGDLGLLGLALIIYDSGFTLD